MISYFLRRLLLIPPTLVGITLLVFFTMRLAPGGPMEQSMARLLGGEGKRTRAESGFSLKPAQVLEQEEKFNRDKPLMTAYAEWLGLMPSDLEKAGAEIPVGEKEVVIPVPGTVFEAKVTLKDDGGADLTPVDGADLTGWKVRIRTPEEQAARWEKWLKGVPLRNPVGYRAVIYRAGYDGLFQGSLGSSSKYQDPVWEMIKERMPVSIYFGLISMIATYGICVPLGILKAIKHRSFLDNATSAMVFGGYAVPGYALGALLVVFLGAKLGWFPIRGFTGDNFESLSLAGKIKDLYQHTAMPIVCYLVGSFAFTTMLMKNALMDNLAADYVRTATAKGVSFPAAVFRHAFRNSLIPIATTFGNNVSLLVAGSMLIERVFDINGFGLLQFSAILERDEPLMMGVVFISAMLMLVGNILSDLCVALVDPRVTFK
ncbi:MAG: ABC transporter permease subunit [Luteolibacter sp.]